MPRPYALGSDFPHERFVQAAIERHFAAPGFHLHKRSVTAIAPNEPLLWITAGAQWKPA